MTNCIKKVGPISLRILVLLFGAGIFLSAAAQTPTLESLGKAGPYQVAYYDYTPEVDEYAAATLYFPANRGTDFGGVAIAPGFTEAQQNIDWWGDHLASHGFAVLVLDTNSPRDNPQLRADALMAAIEVIRGEGERDGSPIKGKIISEQMAVMGHSMGGGGTLLAANAHSNEIMAAIPFTPWQPNADFSSVNVPTLVLAGETDAIAAVDTHAWPHYQTLTSAAPRMYFEIAGGNHFIANSTVENERLNPNIDVHDLVGGMAVAWLKYFVEGDNAYRDIIYSPLPADQQARLSRFEFVE